MAGFPFQIASGGVLVTVRLAPRASGNSIRGIEADLAGSPVLKATVTAPPEGGKANAALLKLLSKTWKLPKTSLTVASGATSRNKVIRISGDPDRLIARLEEWGKTLQ